METWMTEYKLYKKHIFIIWSLVENYDEGFNLRYRYDTNLPVASMLTKYLVEVAWHSDIKIIISDFEDLDCRRTWHISQHYITFSLDRGRRKILLLADFCIYLISNLSGMLFVSFGMYSSTFSISSDSSVW